LIYFTDEGSVETTLV